MIPNALLECSAVLVKPTEHMLSRMNTVKVSMACDRGIIMICIAAMNIKTINFIPYNI